MQPAQPVDLGLQGRVVGREIGFAALVDFRRCRLLARKIKRIAVESIRRAKAGRRLSGVERDAGRIAIDVDHGPRNRRMHHGRAKTSGKVVEFVYPPVAIAATEPRRHQPRFKTRKVDTGVRDGYQQRCVAAFDGQPGRRGHSATPGNFTVCAALIVAPERTSAIAFSISGWKWRSSSRWGTSARTRLRTASSGPLDASGW